MVHSLRKAKNESYLNRLLEGKDADFQRRVLAVAVEHGLSTSDPLFLIMLSTGQLQVLLEDKRLGIQPIVSTLVGSYLRPFGESKAYCCKWSGSGNPLDGKPTH